MDLTLGSDKKTALQAKFDAQKIAFGPIMFQAARALRNLGILDLIKKHRKEGIKIEEIAQELNLSVYGVKVLLEAGLSLELVMVDKGKYKLTKTGWYIQTDTLTRINMDFNHDVTYQGMFTLIDSIESGRPTGLEVFGEWDTLYEGLSQFPEKAKNSWFNFDHYYSDYSFSEILPQVLNDQAHHILDVGGNTGKFAIRCAEYKDDVKITILDLQGQLDVAIQNIETRGYSNRINCQAINLLDHSIPFPDGADIIWMSQFLDCFSQEDILELLLRSKRAMSSDTCLYILELFWDKQKFEASTYCLHATSLYFTNIANGCSQMYHSDDLIQLIEKAGLYIDETFEDVGVSHTLLKCKVRQ